MQFQADTQTTGILVWSAVTPQTITITDNTILGDAIGIWMNPPVERPGCRNEQHVPGGRHSGRPVVVDGARGAGRA